MKKALTATEAIFENKVSIEGLLILLADRAGFTKKQRDALVGAWLIYCTESEHTADIFRKEGERARKFFGENRNYKGETGNLMKIALDDPENEK